MMFVHPVTHDAHGLALKKECALAHSRGVFLSYGNEVSYTIKMPCAGSAPKAQDLVFLFYWQALQLHQYEHIVDRANGVFEIPIAHADDDV